MKFGQIYNDNKLFIFNEMYVHCNREVKQGHNIVRWS